MPYFCGFPWSHTLDLPPPPFVWGITGVLLLYFEQMIRVYIFFIDALLTSSWK